MDQEKRKHEAHLMQMIVSKWVSKPLYAAVELELAEILADGPKTIEEMANITQTQKPFLYRMIRALASIGIFAESDEGMFKMTPLAEALRSDTICSAVRLFHAAWSDRAWSYFLRCVRTGKSGFEAAYGEPLPVWLENNPAAASVFDEANANKAAVSHRTVVDVVDFGGVKSVTDVGGGTGALLLEILEALPKVMGTVAELPSVSRKAEELIKARGLSNRCRSLVCDFFISVPPGSDIYILSHILHDWSDECSRSILTRCREAMSPQSRLLIIEMIVPPGNEPSLAKLLDLEMMVMTGGRERTKEEFEELLTSTGFELNQIISTKENISVLEAVIH